MSPPSDNPLPGEARRDLPELPDRALTVPLLIRGSMDNGLFVVLCIIALAFAAFGLFNLFRYRVLSTSLIFWGIAVALSVPAVVVGVWLGRRRQWLEVTVTGFVLSGNEQRRVFTDEQVVAISQNTAVTSEGKQNRRVVLEIAAAEANERIDCRYSVLPGQADPLAGFLERLSAGVARRVEAALPEDTRLRGQGWHLDRHGLHSGRDVYRFEEISWVGFFDRHLCVWRGDDERPFLRIPQASRNTQPLAQILWGRISSRPDHDRPPAGLPLGRLLMERRAWGLLLGLGIAAASLLALALLGWRLTSAMHWRDRPRFAGLAVACLCGVAIGVTTSWRGRQGRLRFHEHGLRQSSRRGVKELRYDEIGEVTWKRDQTLIFRPLPGLDRPSIRYRPMRPTVDLELAAMRDLACRPLAQRWAERMPHEPLTWTPRLRFLPGGLEYRPTGLLLAGDPVSVPYPYTSYKIEGEYFILLVGEKQAQACKERMTHPNFFVGLLLLTWIYEGYKQQALPDAGEHAPRLPSGESIPIDDRFGPRRGGGAGHVKGDE